MIYLLHFYLRYDLRSYDEQMGRADVWLDGHRAHAVVLDGRWHAHGSQVDADTEDADVYWVRGRGLSRPDLNETTRTTAYPSQVETAILPLRSLLPRPASCSGRSCSDKRSKHTVHIQLRTDAAEADTAQPRLRADGFGKFKITRIRTCENQTSV